MDQITVSNLLSSMADKWPSPLVARTEIPAFTGGLLSEKYCANLDAAGLGCPGRFRIGRKVVYPVSEFIKWLESRSMVVPERTRTE